MRGAAPSGRCPRCDEAQPPGAERLITCSACGLRFDATAPPLQRPSRPVEREAEVDPPPGYVVSSDRLALPSRTLGAVVTLIVGLGTIATMLVLPFVMEEMTPHLWFSVVMFSAMGLWAIWYAFSTFGRRTIIVEKNQLVMVTLPLERGREEVSRTGLLQIVVAVQRSPRDPDQIMKYMLYVYTRGSDVPLFDVPTEEEAVFVESWLERKLKIPDDGERAELVGGGP